MLIKLLLVFIGGGVGATLRYAIVAGADRAFRGDDPGFPIGTLVVNLVGSLLIGLVGGLVLSGGPSEDDTQELWRLAVVVGVLGGFTTMSSFAADTVKLAESGRVLAAIGYVVLTNVGCVLVAAAGGLVASRLSA